MPAAGLSVPRCERHGEAGACWGGLQFQCPGQGVFLGKQSPIPQAQLVQVCGVLPSSCLLPWLCVHEKGALHLGGVSVELPASEGWSVTIHPCPLRLGEDSVTSLCPFNPFLLAHYYFIILILSLLKIKDTMGGIHE